MNIVVNVAYWEVERPVASVSSCNRDGSFVASENKRNKKWPNSLMVIINDCILHYEDVSEVT